MVSTIPVAGTFSFANTDEDSKERILFTLQVAVKQIQHCCSLQSEGDALTIDVKEVRQLCESLDKALFHGLKCFDKGYWLFVKDFTHSSTVDYLEKLQNAKTDVQHGRAWLSLALNEASLESYFRSFLQNPALTRKYYKSPALLCDEQRMQLILMLMAGLEFVPISLDTENIHFGSGLSFFENALCSSFPDSPESQVTVSRKSGLAFRQDLLACDKAAEATCDLASPSDITPTESQTQTIFPLPKSKSAESAEMVSDELFERISRFINLNSVEDAKADEQNLEVVRTKVTRRVKRSLAQKPDTIELHEHSNTQSQSEGSSSSLENRLSKVTMDSGLCLETPCSSDNESSDLTVEDIDGGQISFSASEFHKDISVTFSTPKRKTSSTKSVDSKCSIGERGIPEGQEDPVFKICSQSPNRQVLLGSDIQDDDEDLEEEEEISIYDMHKMSYPVEIAEMISEKDDSLNELHLISDTTSTTSTVEESRSVDVVLEELHNLSLQQSDRLDLKVGNNVLLYFLVELYEHEDENFYKLFCGYSQFPEGHKQRIYFLLSNKSIYFLKPGNKDQKFFRTGSVRYSSISYITVELNYQGFQVISTKEECFPLYTANEELTRNILSHLELGIRRFIPRLPLPSVYTDASTQRGVLLRFLAKELNCQVSDVHLSHYVLGTWEDYSSSSVTPSGPVYQDYLMYRHKFVKENKATPWRPAFFMLKGGVLFCMEDEKSKPMFFVQLCAPHCKGCRRIHLLNRPHAFEIIRSNSDSLQLAASDTSEASKWLQCFLETVSLAGHFMDSEKNVQKPCRIIIANGKIVTAVDGFRKNTLKLLCKANICDLLTVYVDHMVPNYLMLEFEIAEAVKSSGDWIIYFDSVLEKDKFLSIVKEQWYEVFKVELCIENVKDLYLLKRYRQIYEEIETEKLSLAEYCADS